MEKWLKILWFGEFETKIRREMRLGKKPVHTCQLFSKKRKKHRIGHLEPDWN
jgi:hypothetical protein